MSNFIELTFEELQNLNVGDEIKVAVYDDTDELQGTYDVVVFKVDDFDDEPPVQVLFTNDQITTGVVFETLNDLGRFSGLTLKRYWLDPPTKTGLRIVAVKGAKDAEHAKHTELEEKQPFKDGDFVYIPRYSTDVFIVHLRGHDFNFPFSAKSLKESEVETTFLFDGRHFVGDKLPSVFLATEENRKKLSDLYGVEFDVIPKLEALKGKLKQTNLVLFCDGGKPEHLEDLGGCLIRQVKEVKENRIFTNYGFYDEDDYENVYPICVDAEGNIVYL